MVLKFNRNVIEVIGYSTDVSSDWILGKKMRKVCSYVKKGFISFFSMLHVIRLKYESVITKIDFDDESDELN